MEDDPKISEWLEAAKRGDTAFVVDRLKAGIDVNAVGRLRGATALMWAVRGCHVDLIRVLLDHGADLGPVNSSGFTPMTYAVLYSRSWENYYRVPRPDVGPLELLLAAGGRYELREAVLLNDVALARARLDEGADVNTGEGSYHGPLLKIAAELGYLDVVNLLLDRGAAIEATDDLGQRPLLSAASYGQIEVVRALLARGAELDAVDWSGQSALSNAASHGHRDLAHWLMSQGAKRGLVDALTLNDQALFEASLDDKLRSGRDVDQLSDGRGRLAMLAAGRGSVDAVRLLLDRGAVHLREGCDGRSLLAEAARYGRVDIVRLLLDRGADLHAVGRDELTPLEWAAREGQDEVVRVLKLAGAAR